jgi:hypothetical protein
MHGTDAFIASPQAFVKDSLFKKRRLSQLITLVFDNIPGAHPHIDIGGKMQIAIIFDKIWRKLYSHSAEWQN